jgi:hypothetical protein
MMHWTEYIPHQRFAVFLAWHDDVNFISPPISVLGPQAFCVICIVNFFIVSCCEEFIPDHFMHLSDYDQSHGAIFK